MSDLREVLSLLQRGEGLNLPLRERAQTPLIWAVSEGYHDIAITLIEAGAALDRQNSDGNTALLRAACEGRAELASVLIRVGAALDVQNHDGYTALVLARRRGHRDIVDSLLAAGADRAIRSHAGASFEAPGVSPRSPRRGARDKAIEQQIIDAITQQRDGRMAGRTLEKHVHLDPDGRFVPASELRAAYVRYAGSRNPEAPNYVSLQDGLELGIVSSNVPSIARAISSMLSRSLEDARDELGGHLPTAVVRRVQREIISPYGVAHLWGVTGHRFVLSRPVSDTHRELLATILVGRSRDTIFFFTGRYNNLRHSTIHEAVDFAQPDRDDPAQRWFDRFAFPAIERFKPRGYHHIANFVVSKEARGLSLSRTFLGAIVAHYSRDHLQRTGAPLVHSQHLLCGRGLWQIGDPPWLPRMEKLGFHLRWGAESFFIEHDWAPLPAVIDARTGERVSNLAFNHGSGLLQRYERGQPSVASEEHLLDRLDEVTRLARDPRAKLQYFQTMFEFP